MKKTNILPPSQDKKRDDLSLWRQVVSLFAWNRDSKILLSIFFLTIGLIIYVWWPLAEEVLSYIDWDGPWWLYMDWLLIGIFLFMSIAIVSRADLGRDSLTIIIAAFGGLVIESWGTQTNLWHYYTAERPPLWIIPAWPIATLTINRIVLVLDILTKKSKENADFARRANARQSNLIGSETASSQEHAPRRGISQVFLLKTAYWILFTSFFALMLTFVAPTFDKSYTSLSILLVALLIITPTNYRIALLTFVAGAGLGYFLELWGTTRECWTYYTFEKPPFFAILAHGMAAVAFWRTELLIKMLWLRTRNTFSKKEKMI
ncbi:MAG: hypothetical protein GY755_01865 [Chloroflexi bacterium]|nr:hypothetical protein [Chloroflexota bacterium]